MKTQNESRTRNGKVYPVVFFSTIPYEAAVDGKTHTKYTFLATGTDLYGRNKVIGLWTGKDRTVSSWISVLSNLKERGVTDIFIIRGDDSPELEQAVRSQFPEADYQCAVSDFINRTCKDVSEEDRDAFKADLNKFLFSEDEEETADAFEMFADKWNKKYSEMLNRVADERNWARFLSYPVDVRFLMQPTKAVSDFTERIRKIIKYKPLDMTDDELSDSLITDIRKANRGRLGSISDWKWFKMQLGSCFGRRMVKN